MVRRADSHDPYSLCSSCGTRWCSATCPRQTYPAPGSEPKRWHVRPKPQPEAFPDNPTGHRVPHRNKNSRSGARSSPQGD